MTYPKRPVVSEPKHSLETEHEVLETLMHFEDHTNLRAQKAMLKLNADCFYNPDNAAIFRLIRDLFTKKEPFHFVAVLCLVHGNNALHDRMAWLMDNYRTMHASDANFEHYVTRLITLTKLRKQLMLADRMIKNVNECRSPEESQEILTSALTEISVLSYRESKHGISCEEIADAFYAGELGDDMKIPTTCQQLNDALAGGIMPKSLIIVAAGASVGKTSFAIYLMDCIARSQIGSESLFFSIEMEYKHIWMRHVGICAKKPFDTLNKDERLNAVANVLEISTTIYDTSMSQSVSDIDYILTTARLRAMDKPISVIVVDYLGLVQNKGNFERHDLKQSDITSKLAQLAIELNCTVIALSQINRANSARGIDDRCPWPSDAADSSGGHRSASLWLGVDRPELYQDDPCYKNQFVVKCRKNRFGDTFDMTLAFNNGTFEEVPDGYFQTFTKSYKTKEFRFGDD